MGWLGSDNVTCPRCNKKEGTYETMRSSGTEDLYLLCTCCGLMMHVDYIGEEATSYIDESIIGKNPMELVPHRIIDDKKNHCVVKFRWSFRDNSRFQ